MPDAAFVFADRLIAFDHYEKATYLLCVTEPHERGRGPALDPRDRRLRLDCRCRRSSRSGPGSEPARRPRRPTSRSAARTSSTSTTSQRVKDYLIEGDSYEVCLTNKVRTDVAPRAAAALPDAAPHQPGAVLGLPALRRGRGGELVARALPQRRPRPLGRGQADQGHQPARRHDRAEDLRARPRSCAPTRRPARRT